MSPLEIFMGGFIITILTTAFGVGGKRIVSQAQTIASQARLIVRLKIYIATTCNGKAGGLEQMADQIEALKQLLLTGDEEEGA